MINFFKYDKILYFQHFLWLENFFFIRDMRFDDLFKDTYFKNF